MLYSRSRPLYTTCLIPKGWEAILKINIYIFGCLKVSLQVKEVLEVVKSIQTTAFLITLFIHYFIISAVKETSKSSYHARYSVNCC